MKLSSFRRARQETPTEHTETEITWKEVFDMALLVFLFLFAFIGFACFLFVLVWFASNDRLAPIIGAGLLALCSLITIVVMIKKEKG